jgi:hypothetical protein
MEEASVFSSPVPPDPSLLAPGLRPTVLSESPLIYTIGDFLSEVTGIQSTPMYLLTRNSPFAAVMLHQGACSAYEWGRALRCLTSSHRLC